MKDIIPVIAAGGVLFGHEDGNIKVLLIFRRGVWDLPKGKKEKNETIEECAQREVSEEVGCPLPQVFDEIATTYHEYEQEEILFGKTTHWFPMQTKGQHHFEPEEKEDIKEVRWFNLPEAQKKAGYKNLITVLEAFERWMNSKLEAGS